MISAVGTAASLSVVAGALMLVVSGIAGARGVDGAAIWVRRSVRVLLVGAITAMAALVWALVTDDFSVVYVAEHHARSTPFPFDVATAWAALEGSIVLWVLVLAAFTAAVASRVTHEDRLGLAALAVLGVVTLFFAGLVASVASPFGSMAVVPLDGPGPNPLLQNHVLMAVHPPLLYVGYVGMTVPFAFGIAALALRDAGREWLDRTRRWTLIAWTFLTAGVVIGALWSYEVLGWGGYWAWDPVENASFLPWLTATAFMHSAIGQARRGVLRSWNVLLVIATFALTILGTFLTRSGVVASVHSFTQSAVGPALLGFLVVTLVGSLGLYAVRAPDVAAASQVDRLRSREGAFLVNNLLLSVLTFVVLVGTTFPIVLEAVTGDQVSVGRPFFDRFAVPLGMALVAAAAVGPLLPYRAARPGLLRERLQWPVVTGLAASAALVVAGTRVVSVVVVVGLAAMLVGAVAGDARRSVVDLPGGGLAAFVRLVRRHRGWWGGQLSHVGLAMVAVAITASGALGDVTTASLDIGQSTSVGDYTITFEGVTVTQEPQRQVQAADLVLRRDGRTITEMRPRLNTYRASGTTVATPDVLTRPTEDIYVALRRLTSDQVSIEVYRHPFMWLLWAGGGVIVLGGVWSLSGRRRPRPRPTTPAAQTSETKVLADV